MRRVLLATTALGLGAGMASAQDMGMAPSVALSGFAEMGVAGSKDDDARFHTDIDVTFRATGTMDAGVTWSADVDLDEGGKDAPAVAEDDDDGGVTVSISQPEGFGTLTMGDAPGAVAWAVADARGAGPGSIRDDHEHGGSSGNDGLDNTHDNQILHWNRAIGSGFSLAASVEIDDDSDGKPDTSTFDPILGVGGKYSMAIGVGTLGLGAGFQTGSFGHEIKAPQLNSARRAGTENAAPALWNREEVDATAFGAGVSLDFTNGGDGIKVVGDAGLMEADGTRRGGTPSAVTHTADVEMMHMGLGLGYTVGAISLGVNVGTMSHEEMVDSTPTAAGGVTKVETTVNGVGFSAAYALGGGASLQFGVGTSETEYDWTVDGDATLSGGTAAGYDHSTDTNKWSLGLKFAF